MSIRKWLPRNWLWLGVNLGALLPLARLGWMVVQAPASQGPVIFNPGIEQNIVLLSGQSALVFLVLSLACTPTARILGWTQAIQVRKPLGLWGFGYACCHALFFLGGKELFLLQPTAWSNAGQMVPAILRGLTKTPYAREGAYALAMLAVLALTSNRLSIRLLRHHWNRLHRLVYLAVPLAIYHYWQREEFTVFTGETPDYWRPATFALIVAILLTVRIPPVRQWLAAQLKFVPLPNRVARTRRQTQIRTPTAMTVHRTGQGSGRSSVLPIHAQRTDGFEAQPRVHHQRTSVEGAETATQVHPPEEPVLEREAR